MNNRFLLWSSQLTLSISQDFRHTAKVESRKRFIAERLNLSDYAMQINEGESVNILDVDNLAGWRILDVA